MRPAGADEDTAPSISVAGARTLRVLSSVHIWVSENKHIAETLTGETWLFKPRKDASDSNLSLVKPQILCCSADEADSGIVFGFGVSGTPFLAG